MKRKISKYPLMALILIFIDLNIVNVAYHRLKKIYVNSSIETFFSEIDYFEKSINQILEENYLLLQTFSDFILNYDIHDNPDIFRLIQEFTDKSNSDGIYILFPDGVVYSSSGVYNLENGKQLFTEEVDFNRHISKRDDNPFIPGRKHIKQIVPVIRNDNVEALLYASIDCEMLEKHLRKLNTDENINFFIVERGNGNFIVDNFHDELTKIQFYRSRHRAGDKEYIKAIDKILKGESGYVRFSSHDRKSYKYMYYRTSDIKDWTFIITSDENYVIGGVIKYKREMIFFCFITMIVFGIYYYLVYRETKRREDRVLAKHEEIEKLNSRIINALVEEYSSIFYVDLNLDKIIIYRTNRREAKLMEEDLDNNLSYSETITSFVQRCVSDEDKMRVLFACSISNCRRQLLNNQNFTIRFLNEEKKYYEIKIAKSEIEDNKVKSMVIGFENVDLVVREELLYQKKLEEEKLQAFEANKAKSNFLVNMSHDIRTPLNSILGFVELGKRFPTDNLRLYDYLGKIEIVSHHLIDLLNSFSEINNLEFGQVKILERLTNLCDFTKDIAVIVGQSSENKKIDFVYECEKIKNKEVYLDSVYLNKILLNILNNSVQYTNSGGKIILSIEESQIIDENQSEYTFTISDTGIGITEDFISHIYEAFSKEERIDSGNSSEGFGLGMFLVKKIVDAMHGTIEVKSKENEGTVVVCKFIFNVKKDENEIEGMEINTKINLSGLRVLVAEDNESNREIIKAMLKEQNVMVDDVCDGCLAIEKLKEAGPGYYNFVLMDIHMPKMDGYAAIKEIRQFENSELAMIPVIGMTAYGYEDDRKKALQNGMNAYLIKPLKIEDIINSLAGLL